MIALHWSHARPLSGSRIAVAPDGLVGYIPLRNERARPASGAAPVPVLITADHCHGPDNKDRTRGRRLPASCLASSGAQRCAEHRYDESRRFLPQLPVAMVSRGGRRQGGGDGGCRGPRNRLWHGLCRMEGEAPD